MHPERAEQSRADESGFVHPAQVTGIGNHPAREVPPGAPLLGDGGSCVNQIVVADDQRGLTAVGAGEEAGSPGSSRPAVTQMSTWARLLESSRWASTWASRVLAF